MCITAEVIIPVRLQRNIGTLQPAKETTRRGEPRHRTAINPQLLKGSLFFRLTPQMTYDVSSEEREREREKKENHPQTTRQSNKLRRAGSYARVVQSVVKRPSQPPV